MKLKNNLNDKTMKKTSLTIIALLMSVAYVIAGGYRPGDKAAGFSLKNVDGTMVSMSDYEDVKGFILIFTCNHCPYSVKYEDRIIALDKKYKEQGYPVIAINPNDPAKQPEDSFPLMQERARNKGFTFPYLFDESQETARTYGATRTPHVFLLQKDEGDLLVKYIGAIDNNVKSEQLADIKYVEDAIAALAEGRDPDPAFTTAVGCTIKWKD
jgi:peroxiredoxin